MRIEAYSQIQNLYQTSKSTSSAPVKSSADFRDSLMISGAGRDLQIAKDAVKAAPDVREDKIASLKDAYQRGSYNVSAGAFADKVVSGYMDTL